MFFRAFGLCALIKFEVIEHSLPAGHLKHQRSSIIIAGSNIQVLQTSFIPSTNERLNKLRKELYSLWVYLLTNSIVLRARNK